MDELFSVGDAAFQKKCEERMETFKAKRVTILLVSHDLKLIRDTCQQDALPVSRTSRRHRPNQ